MAFRSSMSTEELVLWLKGKGIHPHDCAKLEEEKFTGESFLLLEKDDLTELKFSFAGKRLLWKLIEQAKRPDPVEPSVEPTIEPSVEPTIESSVEPTVVEASNVTHPAFNAPTSLVNVSGACQHEMVNDFDLVHYSLSEIERLSNEELLSLVDNTRMLVVRCSTLKDASANWDRIATKLHISPNKVQELRTSNHSSETRLHMALTEWLNLNYNRQRFGQPTWREVARCVDGVSNVVFLKIAKNHTLPDVRIEGMDVEEITHSTRSYTDIPEDNSEIEQSVNGELRDRHLGYVRKAIWDVRSKWRDIGRELGVDEGTIDTIRGDDGECLYKVLSVWIRGGKATIYDMLEALESPPVARSDIANDIRSFQGRKRAGVGLPVSAVIVN